MTGGALARAILILALLGVMWWVAGLDRRPADPSDHFTEAQIARAAEYQSPRQAAVVIGIALGVGALVVLGLTPVGARLLAPLRRWPWPLAALGGVAIVVLIRSLVRLPVAFWQGHLHERAWGFSTQSSSAWMLDWGKSVGLAIVMTGVVFVGLYAAIRALPRGWPVAAAAAAALLTVALSFAGPLIFEPMFNRFERLDDPVLTSELKDLAGRAGVPVREVLVADASRRTTKENAYVSGFGATKRLVLYDTLLQKADRDEVRLVVAHELGHRRGRHVEQGTAIGALSAAALILALWWLSRRGILGSDLTDPRQIPRILLVFALVSLATMPAERWLSRRFEREADRSALTLTGDAETYVRTERGLALRNLQDLNPGPVAYRFLFTHPAPAERIAIATP